MLKLREVKPVAQGHKRFVYQHPTDPASLIKIWQPDVVEERWGGVRPWYKVRRRYGQYISLQRELSEHLALAVRFPGGVPVLQRQGGIVETDYGIGVVVEKLVGRDGGLAPSLGTLCQRGGVTAEILQKIQQFQDELIQYNVVIGKLHGQNLVLAVRDGEERFVMVDGYGETAFIPIHTWSARINAAHTRRKIEALIRKAHKHFGHIKGP